MATLEAIMIVLSYNIKSKGLHRLPVFQQFWNAPFPGCWANSYIPMPSHRVAKDIELEDPYDVTGTWLRARSNTYDTFEQIRTGS